MALYGSVPSRVRNLRKMQNFWANFADFEPEINNIKEVSISPKIPVTEV